MRFQRAAKAATRQTPRPAGKLLHETWSAADAAECLLLLSTEDISTAARAAMTVSGKGVMSELERKAQADIVRDLFPFRPVTLDPAWLTKNVTTLARSAYDERQLPSGELDTGRLAILADALEEAGATDAELLGHLRGPGPHVWGCFAIDAILGRS